jgi:dipeptidyl aminopeptidase/acylaminoacyl peptidase
MEFSPDGRLLAYMDLDDPGAGRGAAYVTPVGRPDVRHALSAVDGEEPRWTPDGRAVIYRDRQEWWAVDVDVSGARGPGRPRLLFRGPYLQVPGMSHAVAADGRRSLVLLGPTGQTTTRLVVVTNWFTELERLSPSKKR